jgi:integration host factor subunit beta
MTKQLTLTKADLIEEVLRITELPRKESETIVETIFDSIIESLQNGDKIEIRGLIPKQVKKSKYRQRKSLSSSPAKNSRIL